MLNERAEPKAPVVSARLTVLQRSNLSASALIIEVLFGLLALTSVVVFTLRSDASFSSDTIELMNLVDPAICVLFFTRFCWEFQHAEDRRKFMRWGWIDLVAAVPEVEVLRSLRLARVILLVRLLRSTTRVVHEISVLLARDRTYTVMAAGFSVFFMSILGSSFILLGLEKGAPGSNIQAADDALWWSLVTITTVGYGDFVPVTDEGRIVAAGLMLVGLGLTGTLTGVVASWIFDEDSRRKRNR